MEGVDIQTVVKQVAALTGITFLFDPERVKGKITLHSPRSVSLAEALELLKSALALHGYALLSNPKPLGKVEDEAPGAPNEAAAGLLRS